jgi:hypothetical protein
MAISNKLAGLLGETFKDKAKISKLSPTMRGKVITIYGGNNLGKTKQSTRFTNPIIIPFEKGMNGITEAVVLQTATWNDFRSHVKTLSSKKWLDLLQEEQITVICDGLERAGLYCQKYIEEKYDADDISTGKGGFGLWSQYEKEMWSQIDKLLGLGYTVIFIGHEKENKKKGDKFYPKGDGRCVAPIVDNSDIVAYLQSNGIDEDGKVVPSSAYFAETDEYFARTRFTYMDTSIEEFSAENLEKAIVDGIKRQLEAEGVEGATFEEQQEIYKGEQLSHEDLLEAIKNLYIQLEELDELDYYDEVVAEHLGSNTRVSETTKRQIQPLMGIKRDLEEKVAELK